MDSAVSLSAIPFHVCTGLLFGVVLVFVLGVVRRLIALVDSPLAKDFATYAFWVLAGLALVDVYIVYLRHRVIGRGGYSVVAFYVGALLPLMFKAGLFARFRRLRAEAPAISDARVSTFKSPTRFERIVFSSTTLAHAALLCWVVSLCLPVFINIYSIEDQSGGSVLSTGWLGALQLQFAWYANPLFILAYLRLVEGYGATGYMWVALVLSLQTFVAIPFSSAYGYGWGMVVWFMSLALMAAAAGAFELRGGRRPTWENAGWMRPAGLAAFVAIGGAASAAAAYDHQGANVDETRRLAKVAIKRGAVCRVDVASVVRLSAPLSGPLEVRQLNLKPQGNRHDVDILYGLVDWGMPAVRSEGRDYFYVRSAQEALFTSVPARGPAGATLEIDGTREVVHLRLLDGAGGALFDQSWTRQTPDTQYCPDFAAYPNATQQPRVMISQALGLAASAPPEPRRFDAGNEPRLAGQVVARTQGPVAKEERVRNANCPAGVGWKQTGPTSWVVRSRGSGTFWIGPQAFYPQGDYQNQALCQGDFVFLYNTVRLSKGKGLLTVQKRRLADFELVGTTGIWVEDAGLDNQGMQLDRVEASDQGLVVEVSRPALGLSLRVKSTAGL